MHVAIIMDGNGRWATQQGKPRTEGHRQGAVVVRKVVEEAARSDIAVLTLYAFSSANWSRPAHEVSSLMSLFRSFLVTEANRCAQSGVRIRVIGRRDRLAHRLIAAIEQAEWRSSKGRRLLLQVAVDYSSKDAIKRASQNTQTRDFETVLARTTGADPTATEVDLLIRTGGERRLSDFLLWECAYAELFFVQDYWPDFSPSHLRQILVEFSRRERRFGNVSQQ